MWITQRHLVGWVYPTIFQDYIERQGLLPLPYYTGWDILFLWTLIQCTLVEGQPVEKGQSLFNPSPLLSLWFTYNTLILKSWVLLSFWLAVRSDAEAETPILWPPHAKSWLIGKDSDAGRDWRQEEKGTTENEMAGWHHQLDGHEFEWTLRVGDGQGGLACCDSWGHKESDTTEWLNWTELKPLKWFPNKGSYWSLSVQFSLLKLMSIELVMPSNHLILCRPPLLLPLIFPSIRVFSNESVLRIRWPNYWSFSFSISSSNEYSGLLSFRIDWFGLLARDSQESSPTPQFKSISFPYGPPLTSIHDYWKNHNFD